jgi:putative FmdB family regulatory protein
MPLYEYKCKKCGHRFEKIVKFSDPPIKKCPKCKKQALEQLVSSPAIQFKGTGWYVTDYAGKTGQPPAEESAPKGQETKGQEKKPEETKSTEQKADEKSDQKSKDKKKDASPKEAPAPVKGAKEKATADKRR